MLTDKQAKAIRILRDNPYITANRFAMFYFDTPKHEYLFTAVSNQGNGACAGKKAWLCAGSLLGKLKKELYVDSTKYDNPARFYATAVGRIMLNKYDKYKKSKQ